MKVEITASTAERLAEAMKIKNYKQADLVRLTGIDKSSISLYLKGKYSPKGIKLVKLATALNVSPSWLSGFNVPMIEDVSSIPNIEPLPKMKKVPLLGTIACGEPITAEENIEDYINMPEDTNGTFALRCKGDSMINARINDGDIVYIKEQPSVENGQIGAVLIDGEATLKRVYYYPEKETLILKAENTKYDDFIYTNEELQQVKIIGKAVGFYSRVI